MYKNRDFAPTPLCSSINAWGPNLIMSRKDRYIDIKDVCGRSTTGRFCTVPLQWSSYGQREERRMINFPLVQKVLGSYLNIFHQLSLLKYTRDSGRLQEGRGFRHNLWTTDNAWALSSTLETQKKICLHKAKTLSKSTIIMSAEMGWEVLGIRQRKKKASMLVSFISISFNKPPLKWHNGADIKRSWAGGRTKTTATSKQKQSCAALGCRPQRSSAHNGL